MKKVIYILYFFYDYGDNFEHTKNKYLGIYSTKQKAERAMSECMKSPNFSKYSADNFGIDKYVLDKMEWKRGFVEV